jgi:conjugal transfer pilus assembly protein TraF
MADPNLDAISNKPAWTGGVAQLQVSAAKASRETLKKIAKNVGIWFFFRSDCEPCHMQAPVLDAFARTYGFTVFPISLDGGPLSGTPFTKYVVDQGQAEKMGVQYTPAIFLAKPPNVVINLTQGMISMEDMENRVIELATEAKIIDEDEYRKTRQDTKHLIPKTDIASELSRETASDPNAVRNYLRALIQQKSQR